MPPLIPLYIIAGVAGSMRMWSNKNEACTAHTENREGVADKRAALRHTVEHSVDLQAGGGGLHMPQTLVQTPAAANALSCVWPEFASAIRARTHKNDIPIRYATPAP